jgi:hypothetical protein
MPIVTNFGSGNKRKRTRVSKYPVPRKLHTKKKDPEEFIRPKVIIKECQKRSVAVDHFVSSFDLPLQNNKE